MIIPAILLRVTPDPREFEALLAEIARYRMPFGKFGPGHFPPAGVPIHDLPIEYLAWFETNGYPHGRLGELLRIVYETRAAGLDGLFDPLRQKAGGRFKFRPARRKNWKFDA